MKKRVGRDKKGLSPVVATVLLIALVLVLATIIFLWARGFISEQIEKFTGGQKIPIENACQQVAFDVDSFEEGGLVLEIANRGNVPIHSFDIKGVKGGDSEIQNFKFSVDVGEAVRSGISFGKFENEPEKIIVYPVLLGNVRGKQLNNPYTCVEQGKTINLLN